MMRSREKLIAKDALEFTDQLPQYATRLYFLGDLGLIADSEYAVWVVERKVFHE